MNASWTVAALLMIGWVALCVAQPRHFQAVLGHAGDVAPRRVAGAIGAILLAIAFAVAVGAHGWEFGPVLWTAMLSLNALAWVLLLAFDARRAPRIASALAACMFAMSFLA